MATPRKTYHLFDGGARGVVLWQKQRGDGVVAGRREGHRVLRREEGREEVMGNCALEAGTVA